MSQTLSQTIFPPVENLDPRRFIIIKGARVHNLKNIDVVIPRNKLVVITGVSGSGKSSLSIDTLFAEGQRRYVESLSAYARQFLARMAKPDLDFVKGICPAIAIEQRASARTTRSTVGSLTEIVDYIRLLFARTGRAYSPVSGREVVKHSVTHVVEAIFSGKANDKVFILAPLRLQGRPLRDVLKLLLQHGYTRLWSESGIVDVEDFLTDLKPSKKQTESGLFLLIDRFLLNMEDEDLKFRAGDSVQTAFEESGGDCFIKVNDEPFQHYSNRFELDGLTFIEPSVELFSSNNSLGACPTCGGFGSVTGLDPDLIFPDKNLSVYEGAIAPWRGVKMQEWNDKLVKNGIKFDFPVHRPFMYLTEAEKELIWTGNQYFEGLNSFFRMLEEKNYDLSHRILYSRFRGKTQCPDCKGSRLRKEAGYIRVGNLTILDFAGRQVKDIAKIIETIELNEYDSKIAARLLEEIRLRVNLLLDVGLDYLTLERASNTLSGGEIQRINLIRALGSNLSESLYILDEPSIGLHARDTQRLIGVLKNLRNLGNTVVVVEHDEEIMREADFIIDMGPLAGRLGGEVVFAGTHKNLFGAKNSLTADYLTGKKRISKPTPVRKPVNFITISGASEHNLKDITVQFPLNCLTVVTGVSGSGKTTLVKNILYLSVAKKLNKSFAKPGEFLEMTGDIKMITNIELIDQNPIGTSSRSNPATYVKAYDHIRSLFGNNHEAARRGLTSKHFSFNVEGGRCPTCQGEGHVTVEMQFLADVKLLCEDCQGMRFREIALEVQYKEKNIFEVLEMTVEEAINFFEGQNSILNCLKPLAEVGLGYVKLGQPSNTLSGGEAQRIKLATFLSKGYYAGPTLFIFDEPTTGLHFDDVEKLLKAFEALIDRGHSVVVIEHNLDVIKCADYLIDLGPEGGAEGGRLLYQGPPAGLLKITESYTGKFLANHL